MQSARPSQPYFRLPPKHPRLVLENQQSASNSYGTAYAGLSWQGRNRIEKRTNLIPLPNPLETVISNLQHEKLYSPTIYFIRSFFL